MANGIETHEWRIEQLEDKVKAIEGKIQTAIYLLVGNLVAVVIALGLIVLKGGVAG